MARVKTLGARVASLVPRKLSVVSSESWREGKTTAERGYGGRWQRESKRFLFKNPLCACCEKRGAIKSAALVDHIEPHRGDPVLFWDETNWQGLCKSCHSSEKQKIEHQNNLLGG